MAAVRRSQRLRAEHHDQQKVQEEQSKRNGKRNNRVLGPSLSSDESAPKRYRLTESNLRRYQQEKKQVEMGRERKVPTASSIKTTSTTTTDKNFGNALTENNVVFLVAETIAPDDASDLKNELLKQQDLPNEVQQQWRRVQMKKKDALGGELTIESSVVEAMLLRHDIVAPDTYHRLRNEQWTEVENEITAGISDPKPDVIETYSWRAYPKATKEAFGELDVSQYGYSMPTFAMESKGPGGAPQQAVKQAAYDGAVMTHAALIVDGSLDGSSEKLYRKTKAITVTLSDEEISVYANHAVEADLSSQEDVRQRTSYHHYRLVRIAYLDSPDEWEKAYSVIYNAQSIALRLATARIGTVKKYFKQEEAKQASRAAKNAKLQEQARDKTSKVMASNGPTKGARSIVVEDDSLITSLPPKQLLQEFRPTKQREKAPVKVQKAVSSSDTIRGSQLSRRKNGKLMLTPPPGPSGNLLLEPRSNADEDP